MKITVIIPTYNRPDCIRRNLSALSAQDPTPEQVIIADASSDDRTKSVVESELSANTPFEIVYLRNPSGRGNTPSSRNVALLEARGDIIAFLDDDAFVRQGWSEALVESYRSAAVAGVAGRALNGVAGEDLITTDDIGRLRSDGTMSGNFQSNPGRIVEVDHMIGCNMSLRRDVIARLGGFKDDFRAGPFGICEETDICIRARRLGYRSIFNPKVCADHIGAPQPGGRRFGPKYSYYHTKNNLVMLIRNYGIGTKAFRFVLAVSWLTAATACRKMAGAMAHLLSSIAGLSAGMAVGIKFLLFAGSNPVRDGEQARSIATQLAPENDSGRLIASNSSAEKL